MKKFFMLTIILLFSLCFLTYNFYNDSNIDDTSINNIKSQNMLSIMLESSDGSGNYVMTTQNSWPTDGYVFNSELSKCENGSVLSWDDTNKKVLFEGNNIDKCYVYFDIISSVALADYVVSQYTGTQGVNGIYYHDANLTNGAGDNSYRYAGASPNNYVCFGSDDATCPTENLYRIIGVIDGKVKLIHAYGATTDMLGTDEGYVKTYGSISNYKGNGDLTKIGRYKWNKTRNVCWATLSVEYPATLRHSMPRLFKYSLSRLFVPVAVTQTSFSFFAFPIECSLISTLFNTITSASTVRSKASSVVEKLYVTTSPSFSNADRSISSPIVFASKNTIFILSSYPILIPKEKEAAFSNILFPFTSCIYIYAIENA